MKKKKRLKKKFKTILIFVLVLILITISIVFALQTTKKTSKNKKRVEKTTQDIKLEKLNNIDKKISYFNYNYIDRYIKYKNENKNLDIKQVITDVNIGVDKTYYTDGKKSINLNTDYILVNKFNYVGEDYIPENLEDLSTEYARSGMKLVSNAKKAFYELSTAAKKEGYNIIAMSSYRSYQYQVNLYNRYVEQDGKELADTYSARPGSSEHQTGLAVDVYNGKIEYTSFEKTKEYNWMQENAYKYGFILRFPKDKVKQTGYQYESWHYRYVGKDIAKYIHDHNMCLEEYYVQKIEKY